MEVLKLGKWHIPLSYALQQAVADAVPLSAVETRLVVVGDLQHAHDDEMVEGATHGVERPEGEVLCLPLANAVAHPETAIYLLAGVGDMQPVVDLLQDDGFVETNEASQGRQHLQGWFVNQQFAHNNLLESPVATG